MKKSFVIIVVLFSCVFVKAQPFFPENGEVFNTGILPRVDITVDEDSLAWIYENYHSDKYFKAQFVFTTDTDSDTINDIGFRLRGNTSRGSDKKSFKISFDEYKSGRKYNGLEKMNLNGEHNDPSIIRSYLVWNIFRENSVPSSRSNHVDLYINGRYYGLYINIEHIDEEFVERRFNNKLGNLYKCTRNVGLVNLGSNKEDYRGSGYDLKTNTDQDDYTDLITFIQAINSTSSDDMPSEIEPIFNINGFIRYLAVEIFTAHWDAYSFNANNYYLYNNPYTGKFEFIPYDVDNTFGIDWFINDLAERDIYNWWNNKVLTEKTFGNKVYRDRFSFILNELIENYANETNLFNLIDNTYNKIEASASNDTYRTMDYGWSFDDFKNSYNEALGNHVRYGLKEYISKRIASIKQQIELNPIAPIIENVYHNYPQLNEPITIKADVCDDEPGFTTVINYSINGSAYAVQNMINIDGRIYQAELAALSESGKIEYYIESTDASAKTTREPSFGVYSINVGKSNANLSINEFMASNQSTIYDNYGESEDWIEIFNNGSQAVSLGGMYLSDDLSDPTKWNLPNKVLQPGDYYIVWADNDTEQGENHSNFKLSSSGESIGIFDSFEHNYALIDSLSFAAQESDISLGLNSNNSVETQGFVTPFGENGNSNLAYITFLYNMNKQISDGNFEQNTDYIDIVGSFNNWSESDKIYDGNNDGIHKATLFGFESGNEIQYKARMNSNGSTVEFNNGGSGANRAYITNSGSNIVEHWYNDEETSNSLDQVDLALSIYPNPISNGPLVIESVNEILFVEILSTNGTRLKTYTANKNALTINIAYSSGVYFVKTITTAGEFISKLIVY